MSLYEVHQRPELDDPVLVVGLEGWVDAGLGSALVIEHLRATRELVTLASFDTDLLLDYRARRPVMNLVDGVNQDLEWPAVEVVATTDLAGRDTLLLLGAEPDARWRQFCASVIDLAHDFGVTLIATIGAYPSATPHTRPCRLTSTATDGERLDPSQTVAGRLDIPAGVSAAIERLGAETGIPAIGIWAQVPHYAASMPYPDASVALIDGLRDRGGRRFDAGGLVERARQARERLDELVQASEEHRELVQQLEALHDRTETPDDLPTGDQLAAQLQEFLRDQDNQG